MSAEHKVLVIGGRGMLGGEVFRHLSSFPDFTVHSTSRQPAEGLIALDVQQGSQGITPLLQKAAYDLVINCAGILQPDIDRQDPDSMQLALSVNAVWPQILAAAANRLGARVLHMSTDGVYAGNGPPAYFEDDAPDSADDYGWMKSLGEPDCEAALTVRCSIIGADRTRKRGLVEWVRSRANGSEVDGFIDHLWNGVTTRQYARLCEAVVRRESFRDLRDESRVFHFCPNPAISKADLVALLSDALAKNVRVRKTAAPGGPMKRILGTRYASLTTHLTPATDWGQVIHDML